MKIVVAIKQVPDTATQVKISGGDPKAIDTAGITWIVSPYDEFAIEEALRIKEKRGQGEVVAVSLGPDRVKEALRSALAMGCDRAIHLNDPAWANADTLEGCRNELEGVLEDWILVGLWMHHPLPIVDGIELTVKAVQEVA